MIENHSISMYTFLSSNLQIRTEFHFILFEDFFATNFSNLNTFEHWRVIWLEFQISSKNLILPEKAIQLSQKYVNWQCS